MMPVAVKLGLDKAGLSFGKEVTWLVTFVEDKSGLFYMQLADPSISVKYERLYQEIEGAVVGGKLHEFGSLPEIGGLCIAQFTEDQQWYRGQILSIDPEDDEAEIYFIDYGNGESMNWRTLRVIPQGFSELPAQAFQCRLANIEPVGGIWSKEAIELLKELISERELVGVPTHLCKTGAVVVKLFADEDKSVMVAQQLVMAGFAHWKKTKSSVSQSSSNASASSSSSNPLSVNVKPGQLGQIKVKPDSFLDLCISYIDNLDDFHCQPVQHSDSLNSMIEEMQTFYNSSMENELRITSPRVDQLCCAKFSGDGIWYRSSVKKVAGEGKYEVVFLDFGNTEVLPVSEIRELSPKFKQLPVVGLHCCLYGVSPANGNASFTDDAFAKFEELTFEKQLVGNVKKVEDSGKVNLILLDTTSNTEGLNLNEELAKTGEVVYTNNLEVSPKKSGSSQSATQGTVQPHFVSVPIEKGGMEVGWVAFASTPFDFYCQLEKNSNRLESMMQELNDEYATLKPGENRLPTSSQLGVPCCAKYSADGRFYRAELKSIEEPNAVVHFVDYGNEEQCRADELKHLRKEYLKLPKQGIKCKLAAIQAPASGSFPADVSARFNEMVMDKEFNLTFIAVDSNGFNKVSLIEKNDTNVMTFDVAKSLIESGMVSKVTATSKGDQGQIITNQRYTELQVPLDDYIDVTPTVVTNPNQFCCQLLENVDDIDTMMAELEETYRDSKTNNNVQLKNGMPCVALYPEDNAWYRGVLARLSGREAEVTYVDFGNTEKIPSSNIRPIHAKFMTLPAQTFVCSLFDVKPQGSKDWSKSSIEAFSNLVLEQQLIACVKRKDQSNMHHVELLDTKSNRKQQTSISEVLIEKGFAASSKSQPSQPSDAKSASSSASSTSKASSSAASSNVPSIAIKNQENIFITFVESPASFYCQLTSTTESLDQIMEELENKYSQAGSTDLNLAAASPGQLCAAKFTDGAWYRGRIVSKVDSNTVNVYYIDYGNSEDVSIKEVKQLTDELAKEPGFALKCSLTGVSPKSDKWDQGSIDTFTNMIESQEFDATFITKEAPYNVSLKQNGVDVVAGMLSKGIGVAPGAVTSNSQTWGYKEIPLKPGAVENVYVAHVDDLDNIYCQLARCEDDLNNLMIQVGEKAPSLGKLSILKASLPVCAKYSADDEWYRGEITNVLNSQTANVRFIDYGNSENVNIASMRETSSELLKEPKYAVLCSLDHGGLKWKDNAVEEFLGKTTDKVLKMAVKDAKAGKIVIELRDETDISVASNLVITNQSSVSRPNEAPQVRPKQQNEAGHTVPNDASNGFPESKIRCDVEIGFYVSHVNSLSDFYIQDASQSDPLDELMQQLEHTPKQAGFFKTAKPGMACMAEFSEDNGLYRAVLDSVKGSTVLVRFVDYGNTEEKNLNDLYPLPGELSKTSPFAVKCCLKGAIPSLSENDLEKFKEATFDKVLKGKLRRLNADKYELTMSDKSITSTYCKSESEAQPSLQHIQTNTGSSLDCYVSHTESVNEFYVQPAKHEADLDRVVENMTRSGSNPALPAPSVGQFCCAKFSGDEQWYRSEIIGQSGDKFKVLFVDYGNSETVAKCDLKVLPADMLAIPCLSIPCTLDVAPGQAQADIDNFINKTADQILSLEFIGKDVNGMNTVTLKLDGKQLFSAAKKDPGLHVAKPEPNHAEPYSNAQSPAVIVEFNETSLPIGTSEQAVVSYVVTPQEFYCQLDKDLAKLDEVMSKLEGNYCSLGPSEKRLKSMVPGVPCAAKYSVDDAWYRASLECLESATHAKIKFVDYGNVESIAIADVKELTEELQQEPMFAVKCSLVGDVGPTSEFENRVIEQTFEMKVSGKNGGTHMVDLNNDGHSVSKELSRKIPPVAVCKPVQESSVQYKDVGMKPGDRQKVYFVDGGSPGEFYCHLVKYEAEFENLMNDIASDAGSLSNLAQLVKGKPCIGMFSEDGGWYRGRILDTKLGEARVFFVDYGNEEWVSNDNIKSIPEKLMQLPIQAVWCSLNGVKPASVSWSQNETELLKGKCADKVMLLSVMAVENEKYNVVLEDAETGEKVNDAFVKDGGQSVAQEKESKPVVSTLHYKDEGTSKGMKLAVTCTFIDSADKISCQLTKYQAQLDDLMADIAIYCNGNAKVVSNAAIGMPCLALFSEDNAWYRAIVTAVNGASITVSFVDYGNEVEVKKDKLREVRPKDIELPVTCFDCQIPGIALTDDAMMCIEELCLEQELTVEVQDVVKAGVVIGDICKVDSGESITKIVQGKFPNEASNSEKRIVNDVAPQNQKQLQYLKPDLKVGDTENIMCSHVTSVNTIECHLSKYSEKFNPMMDKIAEYCDANTTVMKDPKIGDPCLAKYPIDSGWYRATVLSIASNVLKLRYVDYGNEDEVSFADTREITEEFMALPTLSITCKLHDVHIEDLDAVKGKEWLENSCCNNDYNIGVMLKSDDCNGIDVNMYYPDSEETVNDELYAQFALEEEPEDAPAEEKPTSSLEDSQKTPTENADEEKPTNLDNAESGSKSQEAAFESPPEQLRLLSTEVEISVKTPATCSFIDADLNIHCQPTKYSTDLDQLMTHIGDYCAEITTKPDSYDSGVPCFAMFPDDQEWYRAEILQDKGDMIEVFYVDYGNSGLVDKDQMLSMGKAFTTMPKASVACTLEGLDKISCPSDDVKVWLEEKILEQQVDLEIKEKLASGTCKADLFIGGRSVMDSLKAELGQSITESNSNEGLAKSEVKSAGSKGSKEDKVFKFEFPALSLQSTKVAHCTHIDSLQEIYCQLLEHQTQLDDVTAKMINYCEDSNKGPANCSIGRACLAQYTLDEQWYRAEVIDIQKDGVKVQFVDYGNTDTVSLQNTRFANEEFTSLPATAVKCQLHEVHNEDLDVKAAVQWVQENVVEQEVTIEIAGVVDGVHNCVFTKQGIEGTINDTLYALFEIPEQEPADKAAGIVTVNTEGASENAEIGSENAGVASESAGVAGESTKVARESTEAASEGTGVASESTEVASEITDVARESTEVASESTEVASESTEVARESTEVASESTVVASESMEVASERIDIELTSAIGSEGDVQTTKTENAKTEEQTDQTEAENKKAEGTSEETCSYTYENLEMGCKETVLCLHAESTQLLYCQLNRLLVKLDDLLEDINAYCDAEGLVPENMKKGLACFAKWSNDSIWYRAEVTEVINDREVKVFYVDHGHSDIILISDTRVMKKEFTAIPALTIKCQLHDVHESDLDPCAIEHWLHDDLTASGLDMICEVVGKIDDRYDCILTFKGNERTVNDELYEKFVLEEANEEDNGASNNGTVSNSGSDVLLTAPVSIASVTSSESEAKSADIAELNPGASEFVPPTDKVVPTDAINTLDPAVGEFIPTDAPSSRIKLTVSSREISIDTSLVMHLSFVNSPASFWCQFDDTGDDLIQLMGEIEEMYSASEIPPVTSVPEVGSFCCAQFSEDEQWYRGEVIESSDTDSCLVKFIDYGNVEKTDLCKIKELKPEFFILKKQAVECSLYGVKAATDSGQWSEEAISEFENMCTQELKADVIDKEGERLNAVIKIVESDINVNQTMIEKRLGTSDDTKTNGIS